MQPKDMILMGVAVWLVLKVTGANAGQRVAVPGQNGIIQANNQNADMWLKTGALKLGSDLLKEIGKGTFSNVFASTNNNTFDYGLPANLGAVDAVDSVDSFGYDFSGYA